VRASSSADRGAVAFRVLGPVEAVRDDGPLPLGGPRQRTLLALLLTRPGRIVLVDELLHAIWVAGPPDRADTTIRTYVSRLRRALAGAATIEAGSSGYAIHADPETIDAVVFDDLVRMADEDLAGGNARLAATRLAGALALWRGRAFGDLADEGLLRMEAERLDHLRLHAAEQRFEAELLLGHAGRLVDDIEVAVTQNPYRERLWRLLMLALYHSGRQVDALAAYGRARRMLDEQLGIDPSPELQSLEGQILRQELLPLASDERRDNAPIPQTSFIGRDTELAELERRMREGRLITLTGPGGVGKTRLALEVAHKSVELAHDGVLFVDLSVIGSSDDVAGAAARAQMVREQAGVAPLEAVTLQLRHLQVIVVVDNCEHVREGAALLAEALLARCPEVRVIATSRIVLGIAGESEFVVAPLGVPAENASIPELQASEAVRLLVDRVVATSGRSVSDGANLLEAARISRDLDGLPLAIELAAARSKAMSLGEIAERLDDRFRFLVSWRRVSAARHQTLRHAIDWSYDLLADEDKSLFARLAVFVGGCTLEAIDELATVDSITRLVDASLVVAMPSESGGPTRYRMLETLRTYAEARLVESGGLRPAREAHAEHFRRLAERAEPELSGAEQAAWFARLNDEHANFQAALAFLAEDATNLDSLLEFTVALTRFWYVRGHLREARRALEVALREAPYAPTALRRRALTAAASVALLQGDYTDATHFAEASLAAARETGEQRLVANGLSNLGAILLAAGTNDRAAQMLEQAVELARTVEDSRILALALNNLGDYALTVGDYERAQPLFAESLALLRERGDTANVARSLFNLGAVALKLDRPAESEQRLREGLTAARDAGDKEDLSWILLGLAAVAASKSEAERAGALLGASSGLLREMGAEFKPFERKLHQETAARLAQQLGDRQLEEALARGQALTLDEAVEVAALT
jgi:predicted ATPase/DNA-binding SARP family transcriptional activator